ncbi:MAG: hypothetical protein ACBZ72_09955 [Candidatus Bathyarchaeia archaeon]|jgi:hypothetical protein
MRAKVAVATVQGKAYFLIVNQLKQRSISFVSLLPGESVPAQIRVVVTTPQEQPLINHPRTVSYSPETDPDIMGSEVVKRLQGKETYDVVIIGVDPGEVVGVAAVADGAIIETENCIGTQQTLNSIKNILKTLNTQKSAVTIKIGNGVPVYRELLGALDRSLPRQVTLEVVEEAGTNKRSHGFKNGRTLRHVVSALRIAERKGYIYSRRKPTLELDS